MKEQITFRQWRETKVTNLRIHIAARLLAAALSIPLSITALADWQSGHSAFAHGDYVTAYKEWLPLAKSGHAKAQLNLGFMFHQGLGVQQDPVRAAEWYQKAAKQGLAEAQAELGSLYLHGIGVPQDPKLAYKWSHKAATQGWASGQFNVGTMLTYGFGVDQDPKAGAKWLAKAAEQGDGPSQYNLATLYAQGLGVRKDKVQALKWAILAASSPEDSAAGAPDVTSTALELIQILKTQMTEPEIKQAMKLANAWTHSHQN